MVCCEVTGDESASSWLWDSVGSIMKGVLGVVEVDVAVELVEVDVMVA